MNSKSKNLPTWDLSSLFSGVDDPKIEKSFLDTSKQAIRFRKRYLGKIAKVFKAPKKALLCLKEYEEILSSISKTCNYASLLFAESSIDPKRGALLQRTQVEYNNISTTLLFFELELIVIPEKIVTRAIKSPELKKYRHFIEIQLNWKPHRLSEREEEILTDKDRTGYSAFVRLFDEEFAHRLFSINFNGKKEKLTESKTLDLLHNPDRAKRKAAALALTQGLKEDSRRLAYIFNTLVDDKSLTDKYRKFNSPEESRHLTNEITQDIVDVMNETVRSNYTIVQNFYKYKAKVLKVGKLYDYDRYAPVLTTKQLIPFNKAKDLILDSFYSFDKKFGEIASYFFSNHWIDAADRPGKRGGAFCSFGTPETHPTVFMNYHGSFRDVLTLAHELGHGIHGWLIREQGFLNYSVPLTVCETASVFAEMLVFDNLKGSIQNSKDLFALYMLKIESIFATVFRQISMYNFEKELHSQRRKKGELSALEINQIWRSKQDEVFKGSIILTPDYDYWWSYIPHFIHTPFYVYAYAFGELLTLSLYSQYRGINSNFVKKYIEMLSFGASRSPGELLAPLGVRLNDKKFWLGGVSVIKELVKEMKSQ